MKTCPTCQTALADNAAACPKCGHRGTPWLLFVGIMVMLALAALVFFGDAILG